MGSSVEGGSWRCGGRYVGLLDRGVEETVVSEVFD